ncbi:hypothetical protein [Actinophytocola sediminis]
MPPPAYETPCRPVPTPPDRLRLPQVVRIAAAVVLVGLFGGWYLLFGGSESEAGRSAPVPTVTEVTDTPAPSTPKIVAPPVAGAMTAEAGPTPPPATSAPTRPAPSTTAPTRPRDDRFAVVGERCPRPGTYSITARYRPVICQAGTWRPVTPT